MQTRPSFPHHHLLQCWKSYPWEMIKAVGESQKIPLKYYENNMTCTFILLRLMRKYGCNSIVFSSSATVYGAADVMPIDEMLNQPSLEELQEMEGCKHDNQQEKDETMEKEEEEEKNNGAYHFFGDSKGW